MNWNWFPSQIQGMISYQAWNSMRGFWQSGSALEAMANTLIYSNHTRQISVLLTSWRSLESLLLAYGPLPSFDDMAWYGMAYSRIYDLLKAQDYDELICDRFLNSSSSIFKWIQEVGWDHTESCGGGFFWDNASKPFKPTITNVQMMYLGAKLHNQHSTRLHFGLQNVSAHGGLHELDGEYLAVANRTWQWVQATQLINPTTHLVGNSVNSATCTGDNAKAWTYQQGVLIGGLVELYKGVHANHQGSPRRNSDAGNLLHTAHQLADAVISQLCSNASVLLESCDRSPGGPCNEDARMYKGIFARNIRYLIDTLDEGDARRTTYTSWLELNAESVLQHSQCNPGPRASSNSTACNTLWTFGRSPRRYIAGPLFSSSWEGPFTRGAPPEQTSALELFTALIPSTTRCVLKGACAWDPPEPVLPPRLDYCDTQSMCPFNLTCGGGCEDGAWSICCANNQKCIVKEGSNNHCDQGWG